MRALLTRSEYSPQNLGLTKPFIWNLSLFTGPQIGWLMGQIKTKYVPKDKLQISFSLLKMLKAINLNYRSGCLKIKIQCTRLEMFGNI